VSVGTVETVPGFVVGEAEAAAADRVATFIVRWNLTVPAILTLESLQPLSFLGSQFMHILSPSITAILSIDDWDRLARLLEDRRGLEHLIRRIEQLDEQRQER
jgi:extradiol dioxygenase family protein